MDQLKKGFSMVGILALTPKPYNPAAGAIQTVTKMVAFILWLALL